MYCQIGKIILWPRGMTALPRIVPLRTGALNVISGGSKTGKSAIIPIIDYCLGAEKCAIPAQVIRRACEWFGVVIVTERGEFLFARREPGTQKSTGDMFLLEGANVDVPNAIEGPNANVERAKEILNELAGLSRLDIDAEKTFGPTRGRPSFRDMAAFTFQPQNIVANPNVMFFKADTTEHREKLKAIFPYVLGAVSAEGLALQHERQRLGLELRRKERELDGVKALSARWVAEIAADVSRARELNLLLEPVLPRSSPSTMIAALRGVLETAEYEPLITANGIEEGATELAQLRAEETVLAVELAGLRRRLSAMKDFRQTAGTHEQALMIRRERLGIAGWIGALFKEKHECPMCGSAEQPMEAEVGRLQDALEQVEAQTVAFQRMPAAFDREYLRVQAEIERATENINAVRIRRRALEMFNEESQRRQYDKPAAARFLGHLEDALDRYDQVSPGGDLAAEVEELKERLNAIEKRLRDMGEAAALRRAEERFTAYAGRIVPRLDAERPDDPIALDRSELTIKVVGSDRDDYLWEVGSGANWLTYHVAASIALHELFLALPSSPVPGFIVYDQPSQVYFPRSAQFDKAGPADEKPRRNSGGAALSPGVGDGPGAPAIANGATDEDVEAVRKVFATLSAAVERMKGKWQAIVLDHARDDVWGSIDGVHVVEEWRHGVKLVPEEWLARSADNTRAL